MIFIGGAFNLAIKLIVLVILIVARQNLGKLREAP